MGKDEVHLRLGRRRLPPLSVPGELFDLYQPYIGSKAMLVWLNLRWQLHQGECAEDLEGILREKLGLSFGEITDALKRLYEYELIESDGQGGYILHEPLSFEAFWMRFKREELDQPKLPIEEAIEDITIPEPASITDLDAVVQLFHKKIGTLGPTQFEQLRFWVEDQKMDAEVVALAIEETLVSAKNPRIEYLDGILKNWYRSGIRTLTDLINDKQASQALIPKDRRKQYSASSEGVANSEAYEGVNPDLIARWKELYPDEYE